MGLLSNMVQKSQLQPGDHIYCYRKLHTYSHHGIYVEADRVIHYTRTKVATKSWILGNHQCKNCGHRPKMAQGVVKTCVDCFRAGHDLYRFEYDVSYGHFVMKKSGTCTTASCDSADEAIRRATDLHNKEQGFGEYHLFENNCEAFATYCKTNKHISGQAFCAINFGKYAVKAFLKHNIDRLLHDVSVHHPNKHQQLKQMIETLITLPSKEIVANINKINAKDEDDQDHVVDEDDDRIMNEYLEKMDKEEDAGASHSTL